MSIWIWVWSGQCLESGPLWKKGKLEDGMYGVRRTGHPSRVGIARLLPENNIHEHQLVVELALLLHKLPGNNSGFFAHLTNKAQEALQSKDPADPCSGLQLLHNVLLVGGRTLGGSNSFFRCRPLCNSSRPLLSNFCPRRRSVPSFSILIESNNLSPRA
jgi:hypothetical protein